MEFEKTINSLKKTSNNKDLPKKRINKKIIVIIKKLRLKNQ